MQHQETMASAVEESNIDTMKETTGPKNLKEVEDTDSDDEDEFDFIQSKWQDMVETGVVITWPGTSRPLTLSTKLEEDNIAPLFNGTQWAGTRVWKAAVLALEYLWEHHRGDGNASMLELGCGLGVPGMVWHLLHDEQTKVVLTDQPSLLKQLDDNVKDNFPESCNGGDDSNVKNNIIQAKPLSWSKEGMDALLEECGDFDICLNCDCVYEPLYGRDSWEALADILGVMAKKSPNTLLVTSVERRTADGLEDFIHRLEATGNVEPMRQVLRNSDDKHHIIEIYITRGKTS